MGSNEKGKKIQDKLEEVFKNQKPFTEENVEIYSKASENKFDIIFWSDGFYSGVRADYPMTYGYMVADQRETVVSDDSLCVYDLTDEKVRQGKKCNSKQISNAEDLQSSFERTLQELGLTKNDV